MVTVVNQNEWSNRYCGCGVNKPKLLNVAVHPVHYHVGIFRALAKSDAFESTVCYLDTVGLEETYEKFFGIKIAFDIPLLDGYTSFFIRNFGIDRSDVRFLSRVNPGIVRAIRPYDIVFTTGNSTFTHWLLLFAAKALGKKIIWRGEHTIYRHNTALQDLSWKLRSPLVKYFLNSCDALMYSCAGNKEFIDSFGLSKPLFPIHCAVDNAFYQKEFSAHRDERPALREEIGIAPNDQVILTMARLIERKRIHELIEAVGRLSAEGRAERFVLLIVGAGAEREKLERLCAECGVRSIFTGFKNQSEVAKYYVMSDLFVLVSDYDPSPKALNEAMNFELPVVITDICGTADDLVREGENGFVIPVGDAAALRDRLSWVHEHPDELPAMGRRSLEIVSRFTYAGNARNVERAVAAVMDASS